MEVGDRPAVLIGTDEPATWRAIGVAITDAGAVAVGDAASGRSLLALAALLEPDLIVVDPQMAHDLGGAPVVDQLLEQLPDVRLVVIEPAITERPADPRTTLVPRGDLGALRAAIAGLVGTEASRS